MSWLQTGLYYAAAMLWATFWALVLGFGISAALQVFVSKERMSRVFGLTNLRTVSMATVLGAASSSCSYAAAAAARSAFQQGAAFIPAIAFMFASTNLVIELGAVLWVLMGWHFVLAEAIGALVLIGVMWLLMSIFFPKRLEMEARKHATAKVEDCCGHNHHHHDSVTSPNKWSGVANAFVADWRMLWKEILGGFLIAGFVMALVPAAWWKILFLESGPVWLRVVENAAIGPLIALASFVCSVGNIPLANLLWSHGISFGGVISFIYGDLIVIPLILIYRKYYGGRAALYLTLILYASMVAAGIIVDILFRSLNLIPTGPRPENVMAHAMVGWNYTTWLDLIALAMAALLFVIYFAQQRNTHGIPSPATLSSASPRERGED